MHVHMRIHLVTSIVHVYLHLLCMIKAFLMYMNINHMYKYPFLIIGHKSIVLDYHVSLTMNMFVW